MNLSVVAGILFIGGLLAERVLLQWRWKPYFEAGLPLGETLVPIRDLPDADGQTATVSWELDKGEGCARFWAEPGRRTAPMGLHGVVWFHPTTRGDVHLVVRWAPPLSPLLAAVWLAAVGIQRGGSDQGIALVVSTGLVFAILTLYRNAAMRAAMQLRWAWAGQEPEAD